MTIKEIYFVKIHAKENKNASSEIILTLFLRWVVTLIINQAEYLDFRCRGSIGELAFNPARTITTPYIHYKWGYVCTVKSR